MAYSEEQIREVFFQEMKEIFENIDHCIIFLERTPNDLNTIQNLFRYVHTLKGSSGVFGLQEIADLTHHAEDILDRMRERKVNSSENVFTALLHCFARLKKMMRAAEKKENLSKFNVSDIVMELAAFKAVTKAELNKRVAEGCIAPLPKSENIKPGERSYSISIIGADRFFLTGLDPLDMFTKCRAISSGSFSIYTSISRVPCLEELEVERCYFEFSLNFFSKEEHKPIQDIFEFASQVSTVQIDSSQKDPTVKKSSIKTDKSADSQFKNKNIDQNDKKTLSVGFIFVKYTKFVHDIAKKLNKKIEFIIEGEDIKIDKNLAEPISSSITHLIRNSIDHGIEQSEVRIKTGKKEVGHLLLKASYDENYIKITVQDDGAGIDLEKVKNKAISLGLVTEEKANNLSKKEIIDFIFYSGVSTATEITDVSGRGVGMDAVYNNIKKINGSFVIESFSGKGTEFIIKIPMKTND